MIIDTIDSVLKKGLDNTQKENIKKTLSKSKLSRLSYNKFELSPKSDIEVQSELNRLSIDGQKSKELYQNSNKIFSPLATKLELDRSLKSPFGPYQAIKENEKEIDEIIDEAKKELKSPKSSYLNNINDSLLSPDDKQYIDSQDSLRLKKYQDHTKEITKNMSLKSPQASHSLTSLKDQQRLLRELTLNYKTEKKKEKDFVDSVVQKSTSKFEKLSPPKEIDAKEIKESEQRLIRLSDTLKSLYKKFESDKFKELFDSSFVENIKNSIEDIELVQTKGKKQLNILNQLESKYSKLVPELSKEIDQKHKEQIENENRKRLEQIEKEKQAQIEKELKEKNLQRQTKFLHELKSYSSKFQHLKSEFIKLDINLDSKRNIVAELEKEILITESKNLINLIKNCSNEIENLLLKIENFNLKSFIDQLDDKKFNDILSSFNESFGQYSRLIEDFNKHIKSFEDEIQKSIVELVQAKKDREIAKLREQAEQQRLKEAKELQEKQAEKEMKEKIEKEMKEKLEKEMKEKLEKEMKEKLEREAQLKSASIKAEEEKKAQMVKVQNFDNNNRNGINNVTFLTYEKTNALFNQWRKESEEALNTKEFKIYKFDLQKAINFPLNSLLEDKDSEENRRNFNEKIKTLVRLLSGQTCTITTTLTVNPTKHPKAIDFCLVYLARKLVEKGEETVASRPETSFQYSQVIIEVLKNVSNFEIILMGQFQERCPYVVPYYKTRINGQTDEQYFESLGYKLIEGKIEEDVHFYKRMSGVMHLYFTLTLAGDQLKNLKGFFSLKSAWCWLVDVLNMSPRPNITAEILAIFFKCCGYKLQQVYGKQFVKLVNVCMNEYLKLIQSISPDKQSGASVGRLLTVLEHFKRYKQFEEWKKPH